MEKIKFKYFAALAVVMLASTAATIKLKQRLFPEQANSLKSPFVSENQEKPLPLLKYSIENLKKYPYQASHLTLQEKIAEEDNYFTYTFTYKTMDKTMSGVINFPKTPKLQETGADQTTPAASNQYPVIVMLRGYASKSIYTPGVGTRHAASKFAQNGFITIAPDFFGFGSSDPEPDNSWEARFVKPVNVIELIKSIKSYPELEITPKDQTFTYYLNSNKIGIWGHSNGGQIALSVLEATSKPIPTSLWAPVTAPFPYSILFFSDEHHDEGKEMRAWLAMFEQDYDVMEFSLTQHLDYLTGSIQIHHGTEDEAALKTWSDEFLNKIEKENERRLDLKQELEEERQKQEKAETNQSETASQAESTQDKTALQEESTQDKTASQAEIDTVISQKSSEELLITSRPLSKIQVNYFTYQGADHNLQPNHHWAQAVERDSSFFQKELNYDLIELSQ